MVPNLIPYLINFKHMLNNREFGGRLFHIDFNHIISLESLLAAWKEFIRGKRKRKDVQVFQSAFMDNILELHEDLKSGGYNHGAYEAFKINDPKPRDIHKALVRDRMVHHLLYMFLYPFFDRLFIADSFSCRYEKGTHKAMNRFQYFSRRVSKNHTQTGWVLKCDIRKFFASIDHEIMKEILAKRIPDERLLAVLSNIISSFHSTAPGKGLPLGNLTSQLLVNLYMNEFDQFVKHDLKAKYYIRYADDFVLFHEDKGVLEAWLERIRVFLILNLKLELHPNKVLIKTLASGIDFLGWVHFPYHRAIRTTTKRRMLKNLSVNPAPETVASYKGLLAHGNAHKLSTEHLNK